MSMDAGGLAHMAYASNNGNGNTFPMGNGLGAPGSGFGGRSRLGSKRLSVALPPKIGSIDEHSVDNATPRTSRGHLLAGLRTQPRVSAPPASAPYHQTHHQVSSASSKKWADAGYGGYEQGVPLSAMGNGFDVSNRYSSMAGHQVYALPEQVMAPPAWNDHGEEMDPMVVQQMQMTSLYLAQRQQQLQQQLANITAAAQGLQLNGNAQRTSYQQNFVAPQMTQNPYGQQAMQAQVPMEVSGRPGVYVVYNPATRDYSYVMDPQAQQIQQIHQQQHQTGFQQTQPVGSFQQSSFVNDVSPPATERSTPINTRSVTPPKKAPSPPFSDAVVEPLPPPSSNAFRRGHKKSPSSISTANHIMDGPKTASAATFGSSRSMIPATPMTGTFQPGSARAGEHPIRQPRGPPPMEELTAAPTSKHEGSKNFAARQRRAAIDSLMKAGIGRVSRSANGSPVSESDFHFLPPGTSDAGSSRDGGSRKMSPIGSEMKEKRGSNGSDGGYFGLSSASSSEGEEVGVFKLPPTPASETAPSALGGDRKKMALGVLHAANAAEKRRIGSGPLFA